MAEARITTDPIDVDALAGVDPDPGDGAHVLFLGVVRNHAEGRAVRGMAYEVYGAMAREVLQAIVYEAEEAHAVTRVDAVHRVGDLGVGEASVAILVTGPHRDAAYQASRYVIEEIKRRLPVWKHEHFSDGEARWVPGAPLEVPRG